MNMKDNSDLPLSSIFDKLIVDIGITELSDRIEVPKWTILKTIRSDNNLNIVELSNIMDKCNFSADLFYSKKINFDCVRKYLLGQKDIIPKEYEKNAFTSRAIILSIINCVPQHIKNLIYKRFQISDDFFDPINLSKKVCTKLTYDLLRFMAQNCNVDVHFDIGRQTYKYHLNSEFGLAFKGLSAKLAYEKLGDEVAKILEKSHIYKLVKLTSNKAVLRKTLNEELEDSIKVDEYTTNDVCEHISAFAASIPIFSTLGSGVFVREEKCLMHGDPYCEYHIYLDQPMQQSFQSPLQ